ncbi:MAG: hypothetical protein ABSG96_15770 [Terracidiphilus sp.]
MPICKQCKGEFVLLPNKPGFANVCPTCTESPEQKARKVEEKKRSRKELRKSKRINKLNRELAKQANRQLEVKGFEKVTEKSITVKASTKKRSAK